VLQNSDELESVTAKDDTEFDERKSSEMTSGSTTTTSLTTSNSTSASQEKDKESSNKKDEQVKQWVFLTKKNADGERYYAAVIKVALK
jgi:hypothetical protein